MSPAIAIVGMACRYPDAASPAEMWENALAQRRAFRRLPAERLSAADYYSSDPLAPDRTYCMTAAVIEDYEFDRVKHKISGAAYRSADLTHWLALDIASQALADAGYADGAGLPRDNTSVFVGNTLTGEFSRAATLRLRWPFVRRVVGAALADHRVEADALLREIEVAFKRPFAEVGEETLAGGLSNTIAGRISNYFDLHGGGYTVDGACASSLLAVTTACSALVARDCEVAVAGGVDLSLDPFELVGFAKTGALAPEKMRVYDVRSAGFWPGEGCGFAVLMRLEDALAAGRRVYAVIRGWGISSDGSGGITRPEVEGQLMALTRAYKRAGFGPDSVAYFEGHGTGTAVGDATELKVIARARREAGASQPAAIASVKANIGHTKAAAGIAGLIRAAMAAHTQVIPPAAGCETPHPEMGDALRPLRQPEMWPPNVPVRTAVSAMGFGGINSHVVLEAPGSKRRQSLSAHEQRLGATPQDAEIFFFRTEEQLHRIAELAPNLSMAEMTDLAASLAAHAAGRLRRAIVASSPDELARNVCVSRPSLPRPQGPPNIGFLFPGQGSQNSSAATEVAQVAIVRDSLQTIGELRRLGIDAEVAIGHSLGELTALYWSGALTEDSILRIAAERGRLMGRVNGTPGAMAAVDAGEAELGRLIEGEPVVIAGLNGPRQIVVSGETEAIGRVMVKARERGYRAARLPVSHAFHSPLMGGVAEPLGRWLEGEEFGPLKGRVVSTITGAPLSAGEDLRALLKRQLTSPVRFREALESVSDIDLWIEAGPGRVLSSLAGQTVHAPVMPVESGAPSRRGFLEAVGVAFEMGAPVRTEALFAKRFTRPFKGRRNFFANPCESAAIAAEASTTVFLPPPPAEKSAGHGSSGAATEVVRDLVAERAELPPSSLKDDARLLADLHLNSIVVAQIVAEAARRLSLTPPAAPLDYAGSSIAEIAHALEAAVAAPQQDEVIPAGVDAWVRAFRTELIPRPLPPAIQSGTRSADWQFFGTVDESVRSAHWPPGGGVVLCMPAQPSIMLNAARAAMRLKRPARFIVIGDAAGLARTIALEAHDLPVCVAHGTPERAAEEAAALRNYTEAHYGADGQRFEPVWSVTVPERRPFPLGPNDVLLVTGGGKGIGSECAIEAARVSGARLLILGTSAPEDNPNLQRMRAMGLRVAYHRADVTDRAALSNLREVTAIVHAAGINRPQAVESMSATDFERTVAVKVDGLRNVLDAIDPSRLKLLVTFGSIIARMGMPGEADYSVANDWMARDTAAWGSNHPHCRCLTFEWSVWSGTGMGTRVAQLEYLRRVGVSAISIEEGVRAFMEILSSDAKGTLAVSGRFGTPPTVRFAAPELPLLRFLEQIRVYYPGIELVCDAELSSANDPYLEEHIYSGARLLPGVIALEAMAQAAMALAAATSPPMFEAVHFLRPVIVPEGQPLTIRLAALMRESGEVEVCLRSAETGFQTDHFRAVCRFGNEFDAAKRLGAESEPVALDPARDLYGGLLFQQGRFRRLLRYRRLRATECVAEAAAGPTQGWFNRYMPQALLLGDAGIRDTAIHAIQACIPHERVLPGGADKIEIRSDAASPGCLIHAREVLREGDRLVYDMEISNRDGEVVERWTGMQLRIVSRADLPERWPASLLAPYLERRLGSTGITAGVVFGATAQNGDCSRRPDGKPLSNGHHVSRSRTGNLTLTVTSQSEIGCDCEAVTTRPAAVWRDLLGAGGYALAELVARETPETLDAAATRVWCAMECVKKAGARHDIGIVFAKPDGDGWVILKGGSSPIVTLVTAVEGFPEPLVFAFLQVSG